MTWLLRRIKLARLRFREACLVDSVEHGEGLMRDHERRLANTKRDLDRVRNEIATTIDPQDIIRGITT